MRKKNVECTIGLSLALVAVSGCAGGGSSTPNPALPLAQQQQLVHRGAAESALGLSPTGRIGLAPSFTGSLSGVRNTSAGWLSTDATSTAAKIFVSDETANAVVIYKAGAPSAPIGTITTGISTPVGNFVDAAGNLYVANIGSNSVTVYAKGTKTPSKTLTTGLSEPTSIAVGSDGTVYVSEFSPGQVVEYAKGQSKPARTLAINEPEGVALDSNNNLFVSYNNASTGAGAVEKFKPKATSGTDLGISVGFTGDIKLDAGNDILLGDQNTSSIFFYKPGASTSYGSIAVGADPFKLALSTKEFRVYVGTAAAAVDYFKAAPNATQLGSITSGLQSATGVSLSPAPPLDE